MIRTLLMLFVPVVLAACSLSSNEISELGLDGRLVYSQGPEGLREVDFETGKISQLWQLSDGGFVSDVAVSPDGSSIVMAYAPQTDSSILRSDIYIANSDGSGVRPMLVHRSLYEAFSHPTWSTDGQWVYFTRSDVILDDVEGTGTQVLNIDRVLATGGELELVIENAEQPHFSANGERLAFLRFNQDTSTRSLWVANADGTDQMEVVPDTAFFDMTSPRLSPDGEMLAFGGSGQLSTGSGSVRSWWMQLFGAEPAFAHGLPWDFYMVPTKGGEITKLTSWESDGTVLAWAPSGDHLALMHLGGLFVAGSEEPILIAETPNHGGVDWAATGVSR